MRKRDREIKKRKHEIHRTTMYVQQTKKESNEQNRETKITAVRIVLKYEQILKKPERIDFCLIHIQM